MSSSNARIVLKRGSAVLFGSLSYRQQPRLALRSFSRLIPDRNSSNSSRFVSKEEMQKGHNFNTYYRYHSDLARMEKTRSELSNAMREDACPVVTELHALNAYLEKEINRMRKRTIVMALFGAGAFGAGLGLSAARRERERANRRERA